MSNVNDVAAYILKQKGGMSTMKLQKLCYYSQGWALAWDERPMFDSKIEAWANGPVVTELYRQHRGQFHVASWSGDADAVDVDDKETIDVVLKGYGKLTGQQLSELTHSERPWLEARDGLPLGAPSRAAVKLDVMQDFFGALNAAQSATR